jgi:chemotaxis protein MotB
MSRRRRGAPAAHENHERWLVSYADFITLLFAFFVVMFANSQVDKERMAAVSESVREALEHGSISSSPHGFLGRSREVSPAARGAANARGSKDQHTVTELMPSLETLNRKFQKETQDGTLQFNLTPRGLVISMREAAFFPPGDDTLNSASLKVIEKLADTLNALPNPLRLEGHTDSTPISTARFKSNWELSAARSIAMMEVLTARFGVPKARVAIAGYADTIPVDTNDSPEGRARNRRVDVVILNQAGASNEPIAAPANTLANTAAKKQASAPPPSPASPATAAAPEKPSAGAASR